MSDLISTQEAVAKILDIAIRKNLSGEQELTKEYEQSVKDTVDVILDTARKTDGDLIRRQDAIDAVDESLTRVFVEHRDIAEKMINKIPSAQPERETAKFIRWMECKKTATYISYTPHCNCSRCGTEFLIRTIKYCYICGAKMEEIEDDID